MYGLVLEGGGAKGSYQIGAVKALYEMGFKFDAITGTSIGAINGAFLALGKLDEIYSIWEKAELLNAINTDKEMLTKLLDFDIKTRDILKVVDYIIETFENGGLDITPLRKLLNDNINEEEIRNSDINFGLVTVSFTDFNPIEVFIKDIPKGKLIEYIIASASLPVFKLNKIDGKSYIDGGFYDNCPINLISQTGIKNIIVIEIDGSGIRRKPKKNDLNIIRIRPRKKISRIIEVDPKILKKSIMYGYLDAYKVIKKYYGARYYIKIEDNEEYFINEISKISDKKISMIFKLFNFEGKVNKKNVFEIILPILGKILKMEEDYSYVDLFVQFNERIAEYLKINELKIYEFKKFNKKLIEKTDFNESISFNSTYKYIPFMHLPQQIELLPKNVVKKILKELFIIYYSEER